MLGSKTMYSALAGVATAAIIALSPVKGHADSTDSLKGMINNISGLVQQNFDGKYVAIDPNGRLSCETGIEGDVSTTYEKVINFDGTKVNIRYKVCEVKAKTIATSISIEKYPTSSQFGFQIYDQNANGLDNTTLDGKIHGDPEHPKATNREHNFVAETECRDLQRCDYSPEAGFVRINQTKIWAIGLEGEATAAEIVAFDADYETFLKKLDESGELQKRVSDSVIVITDWGHNSGNLKITEISVVPDTMRRALNVPTIIN